MKPTRQATFLTTAVLLLAPALLHAQDANLQKALTQMDASAPKFQDVTADINVDNYTAVVQDHQMDKGSTAFRRAGHSIEMVMTLDKGQPGERDILYKNGELDYYQPGAKQETIFSSGANRAQYDSLLATGFGATSKDLDAGWEVTYQGMEAIDGTQTVKLDLVPRLANIRSNISKLTIWVDLARDISLKQVMTQPDGDSRTVTYSNIRTNTHLSDKLFTLKVAGGTQVQRR
jgi:outer membrane lipoprotein-sorting protein